MNVKGQAVENWSQVGNFLKNFKKCPTSGKVAEGGGRSVWGSQFDPSLPHLHAEVSLGKILN